MGFSLQSKPRPEHRVKYRNRQGGYRGSSVLEAGGPQEWNTMEEFCDYLRCWQKRSKIELAYWDSKRSKAYNVSNKLQPRNPNYVPEALSCFAYKAWVCFFGRKGCENPCRFMVRARFVPSRKKVVCKLLKHRGSGALHNGHNHPVGDEDDHTGVPLKNGEPPTASIGEDVGEDIESVLKRMRDDPKGAASLITGWSSAKRRRLCQISLESFAALVSRDDICSDREMIEALNAVDFMKTSLRRTREGEVRPIRVFSDESVQESGFRYQVSGNLIDRKTPSATSQEAGQKNFERENSVSLENSGGKTFSCIVGRPVQAEGVPPSRFNDTKSLSQKTDSIGALAQLLEAEVTIGELTGRLDRFPSIANQEIRVLELLKLGERTSRSTHEVYFMVELSLLEKLISRVIVFARESQGEEKEKKVLDTGNETVQIADEDEIADDYGITFQIFEKLGRKATECSSLTLSLRALQDMRRVEEVTRLVREAQQFTHWVSLIDQTLETLEEARKVQRAKNYIEKEFPFLKAANFQGGKFKSGFSYCLDSVLKLRGSYGSCRGQWFTSDTLHMAILFLRKELEKELGSGVFILPPLHWDSDTCAREATCTRNLKKATSLRKITPG